MHCFWGVSFSCPSISASVLLIQRIIIIQFRFKGPTMTVSHFNVITIRYRTTNPRTVSASVPIVYSNQSTFPCNKTVQDCCDCIQSASCMSTHIFLAMHAITQPVTEPPAVLEAEEVITQVLRYSHSSVVVVVVVSYHPQNSFFHLLSCSASLTPSHSLLLDG